MTTEIDLYLASQSPRRSELLSQIDIAFSVLSVNVDEAPKHNEIPKDYVLRLANEKAMAGWNTAQQQYKPILGADTAVVIGNKILGKPQNDDEAKNMLGLLSGKTHQVMTAVALVVPLKNSVQPELRQVVSVSNVSFKILSAEEIEHYVYLGESSDKAGSYAIQGFAAAFITHLSGSYSGVMGLPLYETVELLNDVGISTNSIVVSKT